MRVYISGPMTGLPECNFPAFHEAARRFREAGFTVLDPSENYGGDSSLPRSAYLRRDIAQVCTAHAIALLPGWEKSAGARMEVAVALELGMPILDALTMRGLRQQPDVRAVVRNDALAEA